MATCFEKEILESWIENDFVPSLITLKHSISITTELLNFCVTLIWRDGKEAVEVLGEQFINILGCGYAKAKECFEIKRFNYDFLSPRIKQKTLSKMILWSAHASDKKYGPILMSFFINPRVFPKNIILIAGSFFELIYVVFV